MYCFCFKIILYFIKVYRHGPEILTGYNTFKHFHGPERKRDYVKLPGQKKVYLQL